MTSVPSNLIPPCCKPTQQRTHPTAAATSQLWRLPAGQWHGLPLSSETISLDAAASPEAPSASSYFDQLWSTVSKKSPSIQVVPCQSMPRLGMPRVLATPQLCNHFWALQLGMGKARAGVPCTAAWWAASSQLRPTPVRPCCGVGQHSAPCACRLHLWTARQQWGGLGGCREPYLQKNEFCKEKLQPPSHLQRDRLSEEGRSHALIGLGMATASKSSRLLWISRFQGVSGCTLYPPTAETEYFII